LVMAGEKSATLKILGNNLDAKSKLNEIKAEADRLREDHPELTIKINRAQAAMEMAVLKAQLKGEAEEDPVKVPVQIDGEKLKTGLFGKTGLATLMAAGPAAVTLGGGLLGVVAALGPAVVGLGLFGAVAKSAVAEVEKADKANKKLSGGLGELQTGLNGAKGAWNGFLSKESVGVAQTLGKAFQLIPQALKDVAPILGPVEGALNGLIGGLGKALKSDNVVGFFKFLGPEAASAIKPLGDILGHLANIAMNVVASFAPLGDSILNVVDSLTGKASAASGNFLNNFLNWTYAHGPQIVGDLKNLASAALNISKAFASTSGVNMAVLTGLTKALAFVASNPVGAGVLAVAIGLGKLGLLGPSLKLVSTGITAIASSEKLAAAASTLFEAATGPVGLALLAIAALTLLVVTHWQTFKRIGLDVFHAVEKAVSATFNWIKKNWPLLLGILLGPIALAAALIIMHWGQIEHGAVSLLGKLEGFFKGLPGRIRSALGDLGHLLWSAGVSILTGFLGGLLQKWNDVKNFIGGVGSWIADHKGPISYDATLLRPHGRVIMGGLVGGLQDGMPGLTQQLNRTTQAIAGTKVSAAAGAGGNVNVTLEIAGGSDAKIISTLKELIRIRGGDPGVLGR
jgi:hypothetical protein